MSVRTDQAMREPAPGLDAYRKMGGDDLLARYRVGVERFDRAVFELDDAQLDHAFLPSAGVGRWPCRVLLGHLAEAELINTRRLRRTVAEDAPMLDGWDPDACIDAGLYGSVEGAPPQPIGAFVATIHTLREWTAPWLEGLPSDVWERRAMHATRGPFTLHELLGLAAWHLEHHAYYLNEKIAKLSNG